MPKSEGEHGPYSVSLSSLTEAEETIPGYWLNIKLEFTHNLVTTDWYDVKYIKVEYSFAGIDQGALEEYQSILNATQSVYVFYDRVAKNWPQPVASTAGMETTFRAVMPGFTTLLGPVGDIIGLPKLYEGLQKTFEDFFDFVNFTKKCSLYFSSANEANVAFYGLADLSNAWENAISDDGLIDLNEAQSLDSSVSSSVNKISGLETKITAIGQEMKNIRNNYTDEGIRNCAQAGLILLSPMVQFDHETGNKLSGGYLPPLTQFLNSLKSPQATTLKVTLTPSSAKWKLTSGPDTNWKSSGATISNLTPGTTYTIEFSSVSEYITPSPRQVTIQNGANSLTVNYQAGKSITLRPWYDTCVQERYPDTKFYSSEFLGVDQDVNYKKYAYMGFNLGGIPLGSAISDATLNIWCLSFHDGYLDLYEVLSNVSGGNNDSITWNRQPSISSSYIAWSDIIPVPSGFSQHYEVDLTSHIQQQVNAQEDAEFCGKFDDTQNPGEGISILSSEYSDSSQRPYLSVSYIPPPVGDLIVSSILLSLSAPTYDVGQSVSCNVTIRNISSTGYTEACDIRYYLGVTPTDFSKPIGDDGINSLSPGDTDNESFSYTFHDSDVGERYIICKVNYNGLVNETDYSNNVFAIGPLTVRKPAGNLHVSMTPSRAIDEQPMWRVDGGYWRTSGYTVTDLSVGMHTVEFQSTPNWNAPASETVQIENNNTATLQAHYYHIADISQDNIINFHDFNLLSSYWNNNCSSPDWCSGSDINKSGSVDIADLTIVAENWMEDYYVHGGMVWVYINDPGVSGHEGFTGYMSKYETTNAQYAQYLNAAIASGDVIVSGSYVKGNSGPYSGQNYYYLAGSGYTGFGATNGGASRINWTGSSFTVDSGFENHPVTYVTWYGSTAFASYYGWRLPTEWEWQAVADYDGSYTYGCGTTINTSIANYWDSVHPHGTTAVGAFGTYGYGMCDMAGNVSEWTNSIYSGIFRVVRGGSWYYGGDLCTVSYWGFSLPGSSLSVMGFRVCR